MAWEQLAALIQEAREIDAQEATARPECCPHCYTALQEVAGVLHCPWDGWKWPDQA